MVHQAHNIPWSLLTSNLYWTTKFRGAYSFTNLRPKMKPSQGKELGDVDTILRACALPGVCQGMLVLGKPT